MGPAQHPSSTFLKIDRSVGQNRALSTQPIYKYGNLIYHNSGEKMTCLVAGVEKTSSLYGGK